jgi:heterotetrameric sarcosine oxidase gamma subunit
VEMDPTVTRLGEEDFLVVAPTLAQVRTAAWLERHLPPDAALTDVTSGFAVLALAGPRSRELLSRLTDEDLSDEAFPFAGARRIDAGWAKAWALRVSYVGELGWELFVPTEFATDLHDKVLEAGADLGLRHAGFHALDALRIERGFRSWGHDVGPLDDPYSAGLGSTVNLRGDRDFIGRDALERLRGAPRRRRLVSLKLDDPDAVLFHGESVVRGDERVGRVTSGAWGFTLGSSVALAWIHAEEQIDDAWLDQRPVAVEIGEDRVPASASARPFYDPEGRRLRG